MTDYLYKVQSRHIFHCNIRIKIPEWFDNRILDELFVTLEEVDKTYNSYVPMSYFDKINRNAGNYTKVDNETVQILHRAKEISDFSDGLYDITIMPLIRLWGFYTKRKNIPTQEEINKTKEQVNYLKISIEGKKVMIDRGQEIITGSFLKSFAADRLRQRMKTLRITDAVVNAGGSTIMAVNDGKHPLWKVNINHFDNKKKLFQIGIANQCFTMSEQSAHSKIGGKKFGHIINPKTGHPSANKQIGLVTDDCMTGDMLSTALFNIDGETFVEKVKEFSNKYKQYVEGFLIDGHNNIFFTPDFQTNYILKS